MSEPAGAAYAGDPGASARRRAERRWPMATAVLFAAGLQVVTPTEGRFVGWWLAPVIEVLWLGFLILRDPGRIDRRSKALRRETFGLIAFMTATMIASTLLLVVQILDQHHRVSADALLGRGAAVWLTNVIVFSLWYWELDRGGPAERAAASPIPVSFVFPEDAMPERAVAGWTPRYPDYLFLAFSTATAFSATDTVPVRTWTKMLMLLESAVSLVVAILVVARAINVLPGS